MIQLQYGPFVAGMRKTHLTSYWRTLCVLVLLVLATASVQAQISIRELTSFSSKNDEFSYTTSNTYTPRAGSVLLAIVTNSSGTAANSSSSAAPSSVDGNGLTWSLVSTVSFNNDNRRLSVYRAYTGNNVITGAFTVNFPGSGNGQRRKSCAIQVIELLGVETTGTNASDAIVTLQNVTGTSSTATVTVGSAIDYAGTGMLGIFSTNKDKFKGQAENGWSVLTTQEEKDESLSVSISYALNTYDNSANMTNMDGDWAVIGLRLAPAEYFFNFPVVSTSPASNNQSFNLWAAGITSKSGNATGLNLNMSNSATTFVAKSGSLSFFFIGLNNGSNLIVDQGATANLPGTQVNSGSNVFVANGGTAVINGDLTLNNSGFLRVYGTVTVNGNLQMNSSARLFVGGTGRLVVNGTFTMNSKGFTLVNGGQLKTTSLITRSTSFIELAQGASFETSIYDENNQVNALVMGPGAGCLGLYGPAGRLNTLNNGFQPITANPTLKVCIPSNGVTVGSNFNSSNKGNANVTNGCSGCSFILGTTTLPITLTSFDGNMLGNGISQLVWSVANNDEVAGFTIEYSTDGSSFTAIGSIKKGATSNYAYQHKSNHSGLIFYRLYMTDKMGKSTYSRTVSMLNGKQNNSRIIAVNPTMVSSMIRIELYAASSQQVAYSIADAAGRILMTNKQSVQQGMSQVAIDVSRMPAGILYLQIQTQDGQRTVQKLMKQ